MDFEQARYNMIEQQIRPWDVLDQRVLDVLSRVPRDSYVPERYRALAYSDTRVPIGHGETMMNPNLEGRLVQSLQLVPSDQVLEIGTGSGYVTAVLAALAQQVETVEIHAGLSAQAGEKFQRDGLQNISLALGDAAAGWGEPESCDAIAVTGSLYQVSERYRQALRVGGRLFAVCGDPGRPIMEACLITRVGEDNWVTESLFETTLAPLCNAAPPPAFVF